MRPLKLLAVFIATSLISVFAIADRAEAAEPGGSIVSTQWLADNLDEEALVILHLGDPDRFTEARIPGARLIGLADVSAEPGGLTLELPTAEAFRHRLASLGISNDSRIIVSFDRGWTAGATRVFLALSAAGLADRTSMLDGGLGKWLGEARGTSNGPATSPPTGNLTPFELLPLTVGKSEILAAVTNRFPVLIDARATVFFNGEEPSGADGYERRGHIPGARNLPFSETIDANQSFRTPAELESLFAAVGVHPGQTIIVYCHIGQQASAVAFAARRVGINALVYDGSFEDWTLSNLPVVTDP